mmetsp:Transcript_2414/g.5130  ORF Transcript_2414/g.5130 Transcript_2414/m.5130 type:complete len:206 (-) Transcript_2414:322-939(-)
MLNDFESFGQIPFHKVLINFCMLHHVAFDSLHIVSLELFLPVQRINGLSLYPFQALLHLVDQQECTGAPQSKKGLDLCGGGMATVLFVYSPFYPFRRVGLVLCPFHTFLHFQQGQHAGTPRSKIGLDFCGGGIANFIFVFFLFRRLRRRNLSLCQKSANSALNNARVVVEMERNHVGVFRSAVIRMFLFFPAPSDGMIMQRRHRQ